MPTITFQVNLQTEMNNSWVAAENSNPSNLASTRVAFFPDDLNDNREMHHGDQFTVSGLTAVYLKKNYVSSPTASPDDLLVVVSQTV